MIHHSLLYYIIMNIHSTFEHKIYVSHVKKFIVFVINTSITLSILNYAMYHYNIIDFFLIIDNIISEFNKLL